MVFECFTPNCLSLLQNILGMMAKEARFSISFLSFNCVFFFFFICGKGSCLCQKADKRAFFNKENRLRVLSPHPCNYSMGLSIMRSDHIIHAIRFQAAPNHSLWFIKHNYLSNLYPSIK